MMSGKSKDLKIIIEAERSWLSFKIAIERQGLVILVDGREAEMSYIDTHLEFKKRWEKP